VGAEVQPLTYRFTVGSYTKIEGHVPDGNGDGISVLEFDGDTGICKTLSVASDVINPTYLALDPSNRILYSVSEESLAFDSIKSWLLDKKGVLVQLNGEKTAGRSGCHISISPDRNQIYSASYSDGVFSAYTLRDGAVDSLSFEFVYQGEGPNRIRQEASHAHQAIPGPDEKHLYVCDLGTDTVWTHSPDALTMPPSVALKVPAGFGPRHMAFDPISDVAYVLCELVPKLLVTVIDADSGSMEIIQELDTVGKNRMEQAAPAAIKIHPSSRTIAVSNRFDDTISVFGIERDREVSLSLIDNFPCRGKTTRDMEFSPDGRILFIANQDSHDIQCRHFEGETGMPLEKWSHKIDIGSPVCIVMA
jgi:6-phosphogluconolactonase